MLALLHRLLAGLTPSPPGPQSHSPHCHWSTRGKHVRGLRYAIGMSESHQLFTVTYDGWALEHHTIGINDFAESLLGLSGMMNAAMRVSDPGRPMPELSIKANRSGSFEVDLILATPGVAERMLDVLLSRESDALANGATLLGFVWGAVEIVRRGVHKIRSQHEVAPGRVRLTNADGETWTVDEESLFLAEDPKFRHALDRMTAPLEKPGFETITAVAPGHNDRLDVHESDRPALRAPEAQLPEPEEWRDDIMVIGVRFEDGGKWRLCNSEGTYFSAAVTDLGFLAQIAAREVSFASRDVLDATVTTTYHRTRSGSVTPTHTITKVHEHRPGAVQEEFDYEAEDPYDLDD